MQVAITGIGIICALGNNQQIVWSKVEQGISGLKRMSRFDPSKLLTKFAGEIKNFDPTERLTQAELDNTERCSQLALFAAHEAFEQAKISPQDYNSYRKGIVLGTSLGGLMNGEIFHEQWLKEGYKQTDPNLLLAYPIHTVADVLSKCFQLKGPKSTISTACAAGTNAIGYGFDMIRWGKADMMLVGGADPLSMLSLAGFNSLKALSAEPCSPYNKSQGITIAEGAGMLILERLDQAEKRGASILAVIGGYGLSSDAYHPTAPNPGGAGAMKAMEMALNRAGLTTDDVDYINGHGTGTFANDSAETSAIKKMFGDRAKQVPISSTKSMLGHTLGAAGAVEAIVSVLAIINQKVPPTINMSLENNRYGLDFVPNRARDKQIDIVLSNSFAFGGNNATVILRKYEQDKSYPNVQVNKKEKVVITGIGAVQPLGIGKDELYTAIANEERAIKRFSFNEDYHSLLGASAPEESYINFVHPSFRRRIDQLGKLSLASSKQALEDAKLKITRDNNCRIAVFFGTGTGPIETVEKVNRSIIIEGEDSVNPSLFPNTVMNAAAGYVCLAHQIKGPSTTICSGGVSGSQAMIYAYQWIKEGIIDAALVIASDEYHEVLHAGYDRLGVLSDTNPNPFDRNSNGFVLSGGSVALLLESESHARHRSASIYAEIKGFGITSDAYRIAGNHPFGKSYTLAIKEALRESEIDFEHIDGIFTDARGTPMIDLIEGRAISKLSRKEVPVTSLAGKNGYAVGGLTPLHTIAAIQAMETGKLPGLSVKNPVIQLKFAVSQKRLSKADFFLINSSAFGGTYTSIVLGKLER